MTELRNRNRPQLWEDDAPAETVSSGIRIGVPPSRRARPDFLSGNPVEPPAAEGAALPRAVGQPRAKAAKADREQGRNDSAPAERDWTERDWTDRKPKAKTSWWLRTTFGRVMLGVFLLAALTGLAWSANRVSAFLRHDSRFRINGVGNIEAAGLTEVSRAEMLPVFGEDVGKNIFFVDLKARRQQLEQIPWVQRATVMRLLPNQIRVNIVERQPVAFARQGQQFGLVDASGVLLAMPAATMAERHYSFPTLSGIRAGDPIAERANRMAVYQRLIAELDANGQKISSQISEIDLSNPEDARVTMQDDTTLLHFGEDHFNERYQRYIAHKAEWHRQYPQLAAVDLRYEQQVVLEMQPGADSPAAADATAHPDAATAAPVPVLKPVSAAAAQPTKKPAPASAKPASKKSKAIAKTARQKAKEKQREQAKRAKMEAARRNQPKHNQTGQNQTGQTSAPQPRPAPTAQGQ